MPVHHLEGHLLSPLLSAAPPRFPFVALLVSGGHTQLMRVAGVGRYTLLGETVDDAAGEAFDKTAKLLGLGYPGGPALARLAANGTPGRFKLPRPMLHVRRSRFQFQRTQDGGADVAAPERLDESGDRADLARSSRRAVDVLVAKSLAACSADGARGDWSSPAAWARTCRLRAGLNAAGKAPGIEGVLPGDGVLHGQRRDDRLRRRHAFDGG
jgi:N6-L-threonylcarbamoyladenine synthase